MIRALTPIDPTAPIIVIDIGNTNTHLATWEHETLKTPFSVPTGSAEALKDAYVAHADSCRNGRPAATVICSVVPRALAEVVTAVEEWRGRKALVVGEVIPLPLGVDVDDARSIGADRVCACAAAFDRLNAACTVVSFGSAITVDLVNEEGVLLGGAIMPGMSMQFQALHDQTALLPLASAGIPPQAYGRNTVEAIQVGVCRGVAGAVRGIVEGYATSLNRWPQVVATGGDLEFLMPYCDFIDSPVANLALRGVGIAYNKYLEAMGL